MRRRGGERLALNAEINVVSLIDVMMLLMVIFMLTAPMMQGGVEIALPKAEGRPLESKTGLAVTLARDVSPDDALLFGPALAPVEGLAWPVNEVVLFRSQLGPGGSRYDALAQLPLLGHDET